MNVQSVAVTEYSEAVDFQCVCGGATSPEDNSFARATPSGSMKLSIDNPAVKGFFKPGTKVYVDITIVPPEPAKA